MSVAGLSVPSLAVTTVDTDPAEAVPAPRWGAVDLVVAFVISQVASAVGFFVFALSKGLERASQDVVENALTITEIALLQVPLWFGLLGVPLASSRWRGNGPRVDFGLWMKWSDVPKGIGIGLACQLVLVPLVTIPVFLLSDADRADLEAPARDLTDKAHGAGILILALVVVVAAPLAEEVFFRGMLLRTLLRRLGAWPAMIVSALLFGLSHLQPLQFPALAAFGLVLAVLVRRSGRLGPAIWAHVGFNATTVLALTVGA